MKSDAVDLHHILECIRRVEEDTREGHEAFLSSRTLQDAVLRNLQTMTESAQRLSPALKGARPDVEWSRMAGFRNILVHNYLGIDLEQVWQIITRDIPLLKVAVGSLLKGFS